MEKYGVICSFIFGLVVLLIDHESANNPTLQSVVEPTFITKNGTGTTLTFSPYVTTTPLTVPRTPTSNSSRGLVQWFVAIMLGSGGGRIIDLWVMSVCSVVLGYVGKIFGKILCKAWRRSNTPNAMIQEPEPTANIMSVNDTKLEAMEGKLERLEGFLKQLVDSQHNAVQGVNTELKTAIKKIVTLEAALKIRANSVHDVNTELKDAKAKVTMLEAELKNRDILTQGVNTELRAAKEKIVTLGAEVEDRDIAVRDVHVKLDKAQKQVELLKEDSKDDMETAKRTRTELDAALMTVEDQREEINKFRTEVAKLKYDRFQTDTKLEAADRRVKNAQVNADKARDRALEAARAVATKQVDDSTKAIKKKEAELRKEVESVNARLQSLETENQSIRGEVDEAKASNEALQSEVIALKNDHRLASQDRDDANKHLIERTEDLDTLRDDHSKLKAQFKEATIAAQNASRQRDELSTRVEQQAAEVTPLPKSPSTLSQQSEPSPLRATVPPFIPGLPPALSPSTPFPSTQFPPKPPKMSVDLPHLRAINEGLAEQRRRQMMGLPVRDEDVKPLSKEEIDIKEAELIKKHYSSGLENPITPPTPAAPSQPASQFDRPPPTGPRDPGPTKRHNIRGLKPGHPSLPPPIWPAVPTPSVPNAPTAPKAMREGTPARGNSSANRGSGRGQRPQLPPHLAHDPGKGSGPEPSSADRQPGSGSQAAASEMSLSRAAVNESMQRQLANIKKAEEVEEAEKKEGGGGGK